MQSLIPVRLRSHSAIFVQPTIPSIAGLLIKENYAVRNTADPSKFSHFLVHIYHPQLRDPAKPVILLMPGMLCNGNLFRITHDGQHFKSVDSSSSLANLLAHMGYSVVIAHPRYCRWVYQRYVEKKLNVHNKHAENIGFDHLIADLDFYIDLALYISGAHRLALAPFSMAGMESCNYFAFHDFDPRISAFIPLATPVEFKDNKEPLIAFLRYYGILSKYVPMFALSTLAKQVVPIKGLLRFVGDNVSKNLAEQLVADFPIISQIFDLENSDPGMLTAIFYYVLEPMTKFIVEDLLSFPASGQLTDITTRQATLQKLATKNHPPARVISGTRDAIATEHSSRLLAQALGAELVLVDGAGHVDLVTTKALIGVAEQMNQFLSSLP